MRLRDTESIVRFKAIYVFEQTEDRLNLICDSIISDMSGRCPEETI